MLGPRESEDELVDLFVSDHGDFLQQNRSFCLLPFCYSSSIAGCRNSITSRLALSPVTSSVHL